LGEEAGEGSRIRHDLGQVETDHQRDERLERSHLDLVSPTEGEAEPVALDAITGIGLKDHVSRRVVGIGVDRIRPVQVLGRWKPDVKRLCGRDPSAH